MGGGVRRLLSFFSYQMIPNPAAMMSEAPDIMVNVGGSEKINHPTIVAEFQLTCQYQANL